MTLAQTKADQRRPIMKSHFIRDGVIPDYDAIHDQAWAEAQECPHCGDPVHPENWDKHMERHDKPAFAVGEVVKVQQRDFIIEAIDTSKSQPYYKTSIYGGVKWYSEADLLLYNSQEEDETAEPTPVAEEKVIVEPVKTSITFETHPHLFQWTTSNPAIWEQIAEQCKVESKRVTYRYFIDETGQVKKVDSSLVKELDTTDWKRITRRQYKRTAQ